MALSQRARWCEAGYVRAQRNELTDENENDYDYENDYGLRPCWSDDLHSPDHNRLEPVIVLVVVVVLVLVRSIR